MRFWYEVLMSRHSAASCAKTIPAAAVPVTSNLLLFHSHCCLYLVHWFPTPYTVWGLFPVVMFFHSFQVLNGVLLITATLLPEMPTTSCYLSAMACGLQYLGDGVYTVSPQQLMHLIDGNLRICPVWSGFHVLHGNALPLLRNAMCTSHFGAVVWFSADPRYWRGLPYACCAAKNCWGENRFWFAAQGLWLIVLQSNHGFLGFEVRTTHVTGTLTDIGSILGRIAVMYIRKGSITDSGLSFDPTDERCVIDDPSPRSLESDRNTFQKL